jgi:endonuclease YncB( thermonuclease family)
MSRLPVVEGGLVERIAPRLAVKPAREPKPVTWTRTEVIAAGHLRSGEVELIIAGIAPLASDATCGTGAQSWPCGNFARAAFQRLVRHRPIACEEAPTVDGRYKGNCAVAGHDLGQWLVRQGWAVPHSEHQYQDALAAAQRDRVGQWRTAPPAN